MAAAQRLYTKVTLISPRVRFTDIFFQFFFFCPCVLTPKVPDNSLFMDGAILEIHKVRMHWKLDPDLFVKISKLLKSGDR